MKILPLSHMKIYQFSLLRYIHNLQFFSTMVKPEFMDSPSIDNFKQQSLRSLNSQSKLILKNVFEFMEESRAGICIPLSQTLSRTATAIGMSRQWLMTWLSERVMKFCVFLLIIVFLSYRAHLEHIEAQRSLKKYRM